MIFILKSVVEEISADDYIVDLRGSTNLDALKQWATDNFKGQWIVDNISEEILLISNDENHRYYLTIDVIEEV